MGSIGVRHLNNLHSLGVSEISALRFRNISPPGNITKNIIIFNNFDDALKNKPNIVVIANPTSMHYEYAVKALKEKCHVYIEKPLSHNGKGLKDIQISALAFQKEFCW